MCVCVSVCLSVSVCLCVCVSVCLCVCVVQHKSMHIKVSLLCCSHQPRLLAGRAFKCPTSSGKCCSSWTGPAESCRPRFAFFVHLLSRIQAWVLPNEEIGYDVPISKFAKPLDFVEELTGLFFSSGLQIYAAESNGLSASCWLLLFLF